MHKLLILILTICATFFPLHADTPVTETDVPANLWESHAQGISVAVTMTTISDNKGTKHLLKVYVKNTSNTPKAIIVGPGASGGDNGIFAYVVNSDGTRSLLHDHNPFHGKALTPQQMAQNAFANSGSGHLDEIDSGQTLARTIDLTSADLALIASHSIQCSFRVVDKSTHQRFGIDSLPKQLSVTP